MIKVEVPLSRELYVACSGGVDSMAALDFLSRKHKITVAFFDHGTETSLKASVFVAREAKFRGLKFEYKQIDTVKPKNQSFEEYWRIQRYKWLDSLDKPVVTAHHLNDAVETWIWSSLHGTPKLPQFYRGNVVRPFLTTPKKEFTKWCNSKNVPWIEDLSNLDTKFTRNFIRHELMPGVNKVNPGLEKVIKKMLTEKLNKDTLYT